MPLSIPPDTSAASAREQTNPTSRSVQERAAGVSPPPASSHSADLAELSRSGAALPLAQAAPGTNDPAEAAQLAILISGSMEQHPSGASATQANASPQVALALLRGL